MKTCKDCDNKVESAYASFCIDCRVRKRKIAAKACKDKHQYHKQPKHRYAVYKRGAKIRGYSFDLTLEEFSSLWNKPCHYCNDPIDGIGLDRKENTIGYTIDNTVSCCADCNWMKNKLPYKDFIDKCIKISKCFTTGQSRLTS
jgi:hypothetical protein